MTAKGEFPTRENCDPNNPEEAFLWMFAALPHVRGAPLIMPTEYYRQVSKRLWDLGSRPSEEPTLQWLPPSATEANWITSPGRWVSAGSVVRTEEQEAADALAKMARQQKAELRMVLELWVEGKALPDTPAGKVANTLNEHQRGLSLNLLRAEHVNDPT
jgi:hypothetical protein